MHQLLHFKITNKKTGNSVKLECRVEMIDSLSKPITYIVDKEKFGKVFGRSSLPFGQKLAKNGELVQKMRTPEGEHLETVLAKLRKEFGDKFIIAFSPVLERSSKPVKKKKEGIGRSPKKTRKPVRKKKAEPSRSSGTVKKAAPKKVSKPVKKIVAKKAVKKAAPKKASKKRYSNFSADMDGYSGLGSIESISNRTTNNFMLDESYDTVEVLYATDRNRTNSTEPNDTYGKTRNEFNSVEYGICKISIPPSHQIGNIERPTWYKRLFFSDPENPKDHVVIYDLQVKAEPDFLNCLNFKIKSSTNNDAFIFIHGFNVSFQEAIRRTAQIAHDLSFKGASISYSWPSLSQVRGYMSDEDSVIWTVPHLKQLIKKVLADKSLVKLHLIAHSMGNRALTSALRELKSEGFDLNKINQIILAAPDIDSKIFTDIIVPAIKDVSKQITLYASSKDKALKASRKIRSGITRAGESGSNLIVIDGIITIDASEVDTNFLGHGYFAETKELINDIYLILEHSFSPLQRNLRQQQKLPNGYYWLFPA